MRNKIALLALLITTFGLLFSCGGAIHQIDWSDNAMQFVGQSGRILVRLPAGGTEYPVWGSDFYSADSSVGTAAVHAGIITLEQGGTVTIQMQNGQESYVGSERYGITSGDWGSYSDTFMFIR